MAVVYAIFVIITAPRTHPAIVTMVTEVAVPVGIAEFLGRRFIDVWRLWSLWTGGSDVAVV